MTMLEKCLPLMIGKEVTFFSKSFYKSAKYKHVYIKKTRLKDTGKRNWEKNGSLGVGYLPPYKAHPIHF